MLKDNPSRTAEYGHFPWEADYIPAPIPQTQAVETALEAIGDSTDAFGISANGIAEEITNLDWEELRDFVLAALAPEKHPEQAKRARKKAFELIEKLANDEA